MRNMQSIEQVKELARKHVEHSLQAFFDQYEIEMAERLIDVSNAVDERVIGFMQQLEATKLDNECYCALVANLSHVMEVFDLTAEQVLEGTPEQRAELWQRYYQYEMDRLRRSGEFIANYLNATPSQRMQLGGFQP